MRHYESYTRKWTKAEVEYLRQNYKLKLYADLAREMSERFSRQISEASLIGKANRLGLRKGRQCQAQRPAA